MERSTKRTCSKQIERSHCIVSFRKRKQANKMSRQLTLFSFAKKARPENTTKVVKSVLDDIVMKVVDTERKKKKNASDLSMTKDKLELWPKDEKFFFWNTPGGVPSPSGKKQSWIHIDAEKVTFTCWVCLKYPNINNKYNKVTMDCSSWHKNYLSRNDDEKHKV